MAAALARKRKEQSENPAQSTTPEEQKEAPSSPLTGPPLQKSHTAEDPLLKFRIPFDAS